MSDQDRFPCIDPDGECYGTMHVVEGLPEDEPKTYWCNQCDLEYIPKNHRGNIEWNWRNE